VSRLRIGLVLPMTSTDAGLVFSFARIAEELGFDGLFAFDHFFPPGAPSDRPSLEAYATLAAVAAVTTRVAIGTLVTRASLRSAGLLAKQATALDDVSEGRFILGIGTGDAVSKQEHEVFGVPYLERGPRRDHLVEVVRALRALFDGRSWSGGEHVSAITGPLLPAPRRPGGPPMWIGGESEAVVRIAAREADGWNGWSLDVETFAERASLLRWEIGTRAVEATWAGTVVVGRNRDEADRLAEARRARGLAPDPFVGDVGAAAAWLERLEEAGASWAILNAAGGRERMELIGERLLPRLATRA
jgi:alkanesulfonate monooxygenase SsuD/methylene tetrahydromethanopterin reductase-like flavin-dependent oxidoreductase (luciferase family)